MSSLVEPTPAEVALTLLPGGLEVAVPTSTCIVDGLRRAGWRASYQCRRGGCGACRARLVLGEVDYAHAVAESVLSPADLANGDCLPCRAIPRTDLVIDLGQQNLRPVLAASHPHHAGAHHTTAHHTTALDTTALDITSLEARSTCPS